jgi:hypothetical protein
MPKIHSQSRYAENHHSAGAQPPGSSLPDNNSSSSSYPDWEFEPFGDFDPSIFSFGVAHTGTQQTDFHSLQGNVHNSADQVFGALNLFPLLDGNGHIDLAHLL